MAPTPARRMRATLPSPTLTHPRLPPLALDFRYLVHLLVYAFALVFQSATATLGHFVLGRRPKQSMRGDPRPSTRGAAAVRGERRRPRRRRLHRRCRRGSALPAEGAGNRLKSAVRETRRRLRCEVHETADVGHSIRPQEPNCSRKHAGNTIAWRLLEDHVVVKIKVGGARSARHVH